MLDTERLDEIIKRKESVISQRQKNAQLLLDIVNENIDDLKKLNKEIVFIDEYGEFQQNLIYIGNLGKNNKQVYFNILNKQFILNDYDKTVVSYPEVVAGDLFMPACVALKDKELYLERYENHLAVTMSKYSNEYEIVKDNPTLRKN